MVRQQVLVKVFSTLLIVSTCLGDEIVLKNNNSYSGELVKFLEGEKILFKALPSANLIVDITEIKNLTLSNGIVIVENGKVSVDDFRNTDNSYNNKVFFTGVCCIVILFGGYLAINNLEILDDYDACFEPNCG